MSQHLLPLIEEFLVKHRMSASRFGVLAAKNARLVERLRDTVKTRRIWPDTEMRIRVFMASYKSRRAA